MVNLVEAFSYVGIKDIFCLFVDGCVYHANCVMHASAWTKTMSMFPRIGLPSMAQGLI